MLWIHPVLNFEFGKIVLEMLQAWNHLSQIQNISKMAQGIMKQLFVSQKSVI